MSCLEIFQHPPFAQVSIPEHGLGDPTCKTSAHLSILSLLLPSLHQGHSQFSVPRAPSFSCQDLY